MATTLATAGVFGSGSMELGLLVGLIVAYVVLTAPKRMLESRSVGQSREAAGIAAAASADLVATRSRTKTFLQMSSEDASLDLALGQIKRRILLGFSPSLAYQGVERRIVSYSTRSVLKSVASSRTPLGEEGEEAQGIAQAASLSEEAKVPLFMTLAFFSPIMLILFAVLAHQSSAGALVVLLGVQFLFLDIGFYFSSSEKKSLS